MTSYCEKYTQLHGLAMASLTGRPNMAKERAEHLLDFLKMNPPKRDDEPAPSPNTLWQMPIDSTHVGAIVILAQAGPGGVTFTMQDTTIDPDVIRIVTKEIREK